MDLNINFLKLCFIFLTGGIVIVSGLVNTVEQYLPAYLSQSFRYGKFAYQGRSPRIKPIEVPKRWFQHFYVFAAINALTATLVVFMAYFLGRRPHPWLLFMLDLLASHDRKATVSGLSVLLALVLFTCQTCYRFYETWFVSVFSNGRINLSHYFLGYIHYFGTVAAILSEAPGFISGKALIGRFPSLAGPVRYGNRVDHSDSAPIVVWRETTRPPKRTNGFGQMSSLRQCDGTLTVGYDTGTHLSNMCPQDRSSCRRHLYSALGAALPLAGNSSKMPLGVANPL
ncbi:polyprenol reductase-like [Anabrus simplex]|uniref:polyprenol reductase-like n=1 Tax=Anabrus simplex TaxID=316456 RepID=UPI0035A3D4D5